MARLSQLSRSIRGRAALVTLGRYGEPEEVAHAILGLVLPASSYINGAVLVVDRGLIAKNG
jgi:3-oxoacyl-[acyl-carrier protein] reductase